MSIIYLIGFMGAGKSTVGQLLADRLARPFIDLDDEIEAQAGSSISDLFEQQGETEFRRLESMALKKVAESDAAIVACGGGVVVRDENRVVLKDSGIVVYLRVSAPEALARIGGTATRPLLSGTGGAVAATSLLASREALYAAVADITVDTEGLDAHEVVEQVSGVLELRS